MPVIYLSPSTQTWNLYVNGGTEQYYMNKIADAMAPYLTASGIQYTRNSAGMTAATSIEESNEGNYDLHLALHSNAAPEGQSGTIRGTDVYYYPGNTRGYDAATIIANNLKEIYPLPDKVRAIPSTTIGEVRRTKAPGVLIEYAYHDNVQDANWIKDNIQEIGENTVMSLTDYFDIPFVSPQPIRTGTVRTTSGNLNIRNRPSITSAIKGKIPNGATITVYSQTGDWYIVEYNGIVGYAAKPFVRV